jgi:hypothetical protein
MARSKTRPMDLYPESEAALEHAGRAIADTWTATEFESLVPLYVGGDLEPVEALAMQVWLTRHPERGADVQAALAARQVLLQSAEACNTEGLDLWPGIRAALHAEGWIGAARATAREGASLPAGPLLDPAGPVTRGSSAAPRRPRALHRYAGSATAAAAALLFTGGLAWLLGFGELTASSRQGGVPGAQRGSGTVAHGATTPRAIAAVPASTRSVLAGSAPDVRLIAQPELPRGVVRLGELEGPPMELNAVDVDLGNYYPGTVFPIGRPAPANTSLVGGVEGTGDVFLAPPRRR